MTVVAIKNKKLTPYLDILPEFLSSYNNGISGC